MDEKLQGWINLFKPKGISSFSAIYKIKKKFNIKKIGHAGTLDPNAEGILPIAINKTTKLIPFVNISSKKYLFKIKWGEQTSTDDSEGEVLNYSNKIPNKEEINKIIEEINSQKYVFQKFLSKARLNSKFTPKIIFYLDDSFDEAEKIEKLLLNKDVLRDLDG